MYREIWHCAKYIYSLYRLFNNETDYNVERTKRYALRCGPIGMKLLQFLVSTGRFFSNEYSKRLEFVFEDNPVHEFYYTEELYKKDFGRSIYDDFDIDGDNTKDPMPIGSGTLGQVYKMYDRTLQKYVAVKVKHPDAGHQARLFASTIFVVIRMLEKLVTLPFAILIKEFIGNIEIQLDYSKEAENILKMRENIAHESHILIPEVYRHTANFIVMSYHEGMPYTELESEEMRKLVSIEVYFFVMSSVLNHDLIHCDLHMGNWKVNVHDDGSYDIIVYDFGLTASLHDYDVAKKIVMIMFNDDFYTLSKLVAEETAQSHPNWPKYVDAINKIKDTPVDNYADRYTYLFKEAMVLGLPLNMTIMRVVQGILLCMKVINVTRSNLAKIMGKDGNCAEVMIPYNLGLTKKLNKYHELGAVFQEWIDEDPRINEYFYNWLEENFGHRDASVFVDITVDGLVL